MKLRRGIRAKEKKVENDWSSRSFSKTWRDFLPFSALKMEETD
jgi:hypothetical protein